MLKGQIFESNMKTMLKLTSLNLIFSSLENEEKRGLLLYLLLKIRDASDFLSPSPCLQSHFLYLRTPLDNGQAH